MLAPGDRMPPLEIQTPAGYLRIADLRQRHHLVLVFLSGLDDTSKVGWTAAAEAAAVRAAGDAVVAVSTVAPPGMPAPGLLVVDRWGEVQHVQGLTARADPGELAEWVDWIRHHCPECQGEAR